MRNIHSLIDNLTYAELKFVKALFPYLYKTIGSNDKEVLVNISQIAKSSKYIGVNGTKAMKALDVAEIITYRSYGNKGTMIKVISPTGVMQLRKFFEGEGAHV